MSRSSTVRGQAQDSLDWIELLAAMAQRWAVPAGPRTAPTAVGQTTIDVKLAGAATTGG
ncbi:MAG: hypothetical protein LBL92_03850 [Propionibacteriaceae bacterium]|nr:hypothetical protein [Propionibacteriaceae bacterium]